MAVALIRELGAQDRHEQLDQRGVRDYLADLACGAQRIEAALIERPPREDGEQPVLEVEVFVEACDLATGKSLAGPFGVRSTQKS